MIFNLFPINGPLKESLLIIESLIVFFFLELGILFWLRVKSEKIDKLKSLQERAYIWIFFGYAIMWSFRIVGDFFISSNLLRTIILNFGFLIQIICVCVFIKIIENYKIFIKRYLFTKISGVMTIFYIIVFFTFIYFAHYISSVFWIIIIIFFIIYLKELDSHFHIKGELGNFRLDSVKFGLGLILIFVGYQFSTFEYLIENFGFGIRLIGDISQLIGLIFILFFLFSMPSFSEYEWQDKIDSLFIMHKSGLFIYKKFFRKDFHTLNESIITGTLTTLKMMLEKISISEGISIIRQKEKIIVIEPGKSVYGVLICNEELESLKILLNKFIEKVEMIYYNVLISWDGNLNIFKPIDDIAEEVFYVQ
ncbi:MAG: hypothetical protein EU535_02555 [Promethearchaeota archaeon]|nr:MAG: hypothetical protein EU535_02555 [Candidatus Lokiarchaeota archaeon]